MKKQIIKSISIICATLLITLGNSFFAGYGVAMADETPPKQRVGISSEKLQSVDLGPEIDGMQGRHLRLRRVTLEPGGNNTLHSHAGRPAVVYVLEGTITEHRNGAVINHPPGDSWFGNREAKHWIENKGTKPALILVVDIFKEKP